MRRAPWAPELIDAVGHDPVVLSESLHDVARANDWFGGTRSLRRALLPFRGEPALSILDVGTGSGEIVLATMRWLARSGTRVSAIGLDNHPDALDVARSRAPALPLIRGDVCALPLPDRSVDVVLATLILHHLPDAMQAEALREMARVARRAVIVAELERNRVHWMGARLLAGTIWRRNPLTRHDGPVSVRRGYTPAELETIAADAGLPGRARRFWFYRLVLTIDVPRP